MSDAISPRDQATREADQALAEARAEQRSQGNEMLGMGAGIGAIGVLTATAFGAVCPACVVAAPALIGVGLYKRLRAREPAQVPETELDEAEAHGATARPRRNGRSVGATSSVALSTRDSPCVG